MPIHDWTRVSAGTFHHFHGTWITHISDALNGGLLPGSYYAMTEQHAGQIVADILTLESDEAVESSSPESSDVAILEAPPRLSRKVVMSENATYRVLRRSLAIRRTSNHRLVALVEILSPANKDRDESVADFVEKVHAALNHGCHLLVIDLLPPGRYDPYGMHEAVWSAFRDPEEPIVPLARPLTLAAYVAGKLPEAHLEPASVGDALPDMPLFLDSRRYINVPLEQTYERAYRGMPAFWRGVVEGRETPP